MIFNDVVEQSNKTGEVVFKLSEIITKFKECIDAHTKWYELAFTVCLTKNIVGNTNEAVSTANSLKDATRQYLTDFKERLISIDFSDLGMTLAELKNINNDLLTQSFSEEVMSNYKIIHHFKTIKELDKVAQEYPNVIKAIKAVVDEFEKIIYSIRNINAINKKLSRGAEEKLFEIRFLNENTNIESTTESFKSLNSIYEKLCMITKASTTEEPLTFARLESGSIFAWISGNKETLILMGSVITFAYKVYMDQFSRTAKIKNISNCVDTLKKLSDIINSYKDLGYDVFEEEQLSKECLGGILNETHKLFKNNPDIKLNGERLGIEEVKKELLNQPLQIEESDENIKESVIE